MLRSVSQLFEAIKKEYPGAVYSAAQDAEETDDEIEVGNGVTVQVPNELSPTCCCIATVCTFRGATMAMCLPRTLGEVQQILTDIKESLQK